VLARAGRIWLWAGSIRANGRVVLDGLQWEVDRLANLSLADENKAASELRVKAQDQLSERTARAFIPFLRAMKAECDVRAVSRYLHYLLHRRDDGVELALVKYQSAGLRRERIYVHVEAMMAQVSPDALPVLNGVTMFWEMPPFVLSAPSE
jgi:hypothetical protein